MLHSPDGMTGPRDLPRSLTHPRPAHLVLRGGTVFSGWAVGAKVVIEGEVVFNTSMTGYQEMLTDPSYHGQILTLTTSHVGQVGINPEDAESDRIWARALVDPPSSMAESHGLAEPLVGVTPARDDLALPNLVERSVGLDSGQPGFRVRVGIWGRGRH